MTARGPLKPEQFLERFFGEGNELSLSDPRLAASLDPWVRRVKEGNRRLLLPRRVDGRTTWYALTDTARHARAFREELLAAVGTSYSDFRGIPATLWPSDPVEAAILDFSCQYAFRLSVVNPEYEDSCRAVLARMLALHEDRPPTHSLVNRSPGLILRDLELAFQQSDRHAADAAMEELRATGHLDGQNLRFLGIRYKEAFQDWDAIYEEVAVGTILEVRRPRKITQALLRSVYWVELASFEDKVSVAEALAHFESQVLPRIAKLLESREGMSASEVAKLFMLKAAATRQPKLRDAILEGSSLSGANRAYLQALSDLVPDKERILQREHDEAIEHYLLGDKDRAFELLIQGGGGHKRLPLLVRCALEIGTLGSAEAALGEVGRLGPEELAELRGDSRVARQLDELEQLFASPSIGVPTGWLDWLSMVAEGDLDDNKAAELAQQGAEEWSREDLLIRPGEVQELADAMLSVDKATMRQLRLALPHLQKFLLSGDTPSPALKPLLRTLLWLYAFDEASSIATCRAAMDILEELARCGLRQREYKDAVDILYELLGSGLPFDLVVRALELLEALVTLAPANDETTRLAALVQIGVQRWSERLGRAQLKLFNQLGRELGAGVEVRLPSSEALSTETEELGHLRGTVLAMYSLNERALARVKSVLETTVDGIRVLTFSDKVGGSPALREAARTANPFLVATGAAKHAATEFIERHRSADLVTLRTHGKGSASLLRLAEEANALLG